MNEAAPAKRARLAAPARRAALLESACQVFAAHGYRGTTTAEIARAAGVSEPILYRHFSSKRDLYLDCVDEAWSRVRTLWEGVIDRESDPARWIPEMGQAIRTSSDRVLISRLWVQALGEGSEDAIIRGHMRGHLRAVHAYLTDVHRRAQQAGGIHPDREPRAEAWVFMSIGLLRSVSDTLGHFVDADLPAVADARARWLTGR